MDVLFKNLPKDFKCSECGAPKDGFKIKE
ncbi:MAG: rubredoxin [Candidatus Lokiarchaeota archaeon]|nr:rubredoxin [Candidatus Lokiarchaeota archaeon]